MQLTILSAFIAGQQFSNVDFYDVAKHYLKERYNKLEDWPSVKASADLAYLQGGLFALTVHLVDDPGDYIVWEGNKLFYLSHNKTFYDSNNFCH